MKLDKEQSLHSIELRQVDNTEGKMILEGYPVAFNKETVIRMPNRKPFIEIIDPHAFDEADLSDVCLRYNHSEGFTILARTRNGSLTLTPDSEGLFMHAELIDTTTNVDIYKMAKAELLTEGSFAFTVAEHEVTRGAEMDIRRITKVGKLFDVSICDNGAYGDNTKIYARSVEALERALLQADAEEATRIKVMRMRNKNIINLLRR